MVTWTFDLLALSIGFAVGMFFGCAILLFAEMRDGGAWSKGFYEGCDAKHIIEFLNQEKKDAMKKERY